ncbi:MAG: hypothetical protein M1297_07975 [Nitrospirae bacterium]|nr:hypothetical protein [Nitrospirota bacterium]
MTIPFSILFSRPRIRTALIAIPLCVSGIALIFWLKPASGSTIRGLSLLTAAIQALGALSIVLFFVALREYRSLMESRRKIHRTAIGKKALLEKARKIGRNCCVDTSPNPEHIEEWIENAGSFFRGSLMDLMDAHPVASADFSEVTAAVEEGFRSLLETQNRNREESSLSLSTPEILGLVPPIFREIEKDHEVQYRLEKEIPAPLLPEGQE